MKPLLECLNKETADSITINGDFNEDQLSIRNKPILNLFTSYGFEQIVKVPTTEKGTMLDLMFIRCCDSSKLLSTGTIQTYYSDHDAIYCIMSI